MVDTAVAQTGRRFYVYVIFRTDGTPCYVGKGTGGRWQQHVKRSHNKRLSRIFAGANGDLPILKVRENLTDAEAIETEIALIAAIGRLDRKCGPLVNRTDGGEGMAGYIQSAETRRLHGLASLAWHSTPEGKETVRKAMEARSEKPEVWIKVSAGVAKYHAAMTNDERARRSRKISAATRAAMNEQGGGEKVSRARAGKPLTSAQAAVLGRMAEVNRSSKHVMTEGRQRALDLAHKANTGRKQSEATRAKMRASHAKRLGRPECQQSPSTEAA